MHQGFAAVLISAVLFYERHQIYGSGDHRVTMKKPTFKKHPAKMTSTELAESIFHPKVLKAAREHLDNERVKPARRPVKSAK
jgi:hypothetical protein